MTVEVTGPVAFVSGSPALLLQLVRNLGTTAIVHNLPEGGFVQVALAGAGFVELTVEGTASS